MALKAWGEEYRTTIVCVDSYENRTLRGRFYNPYLSEGKSFRCMTHFLLEMEQVLNAMEFPQSFTQARSFALPPCHATGPPDEPDILVGARATFALRVLFRRNASWQGSVTWQEGKREESFRSVLELILLMDSALSLPYPTVTFPGKPHAVHRQLKY